MPIVLLFYKTDGDAVRFSFGDDLFDRNNSRKARIWFAFPPKSDGSLLTDGEAWNIAILSGTLRIANANCLSFGDDLFDRNNSRKARIWFAFPPKSASSSLVSLKGGILPMRNIFLVPTLQSRNFILEIFKLWSTYYILQ